MDQSAVGTPGGPPADGLYLIGFAVRSELDQCMADLERARADFAEIPAPIFQRTRVPAEALHELPEQPTIPVLDLRGDQVANWTAERYLSALAEFRTNPAVEVIRSSTESAAIPPGSADQAGAAQEVEGADPAGTDRPVAPKHAAQNTPLPRPALPDGPVGGASGARWLGEMILGALPQALFASDLEGHTLFYNERFETVVLTRPALKNQIRFAETFLLELNRTLLAESFAADPRRKRGQALSTFHPELKLRVRVQNLEHEGRIQGYLYIFHDPGEGELFQQFVDRVVHGEGLETIIDEVESQFIYLMLERHGQNVSHTARALKIKRSTLQNKMKRLRIDERFDRQIKGPVRRHRRTTSQLLADRAAEATLAAAMAEPEAAADAKPGSTPSAKKTTVTTAKHTGAKSARKPAAKKASKQAGGKDTKKRGAARKATKKAAQKTPKTRAKAVKKAAKKIAKKVVKKTAGKSAKKKGKTAARRKRGG